MIYYAKVSIFSRDERKQSSNQLCFLHAL